MATEVRAAVLDAPRRPLAVERLALDPPGPGEVQVRIAASGVCHSDLRVIEGEWSSPLPIVLGHEGAGVVEEVGAGVEDVAPGDHVVLSWFAPCRRCRGCATGRPWACTGTRANESVMPDGTTRLRRDDGAAVHAYLAVGSFAERAIVPESGAIRVPAELPFDVGALIGCGVATGVGAVLNNARLPAGASAVVLGCGGVGLSAVMGARLSGADPIVAVDLSPARLELAQELGATHAVRGDGDVRREVRAATGGGADYGFEATGEIALAELLPRLLAPGGVGVLVGMPPEGTRAALDVYALTAAGKTLIGSNYGGTVPAVDFPRLARLHLAGRLPLDRIVGDRIALDDIDGAFTAMRERRGARAVVVYD